MYVFEMLYFTLIFFFNIIFVIIFGSIILFSYMKPHYRHLLALMSDNIYMSDNIDLIHENLITTSFQKNIIDGPLCICGRP